jgi:hypothetical protein
MCHYAECRGAIITVVKSFIVQASRCESIIGKEGDGKRTELGYAGV